MRASGNGVSVAVPAAAPKAASPRPGARPQPVASQPDSTSAVAPTLAPFGRPALQPVASKKDFTVFS